jgi:putative Ca2+/H+ antiporter (TMEM165/GDT1 family)
MLCSTADAAAVDVFLGLLLAAFLAAVLPAVVLSFFLEVLREVLSAVFFFLVGIVMTDDEETMEMAAVSRWRQL